MCAQLRKGALVGKKVANIEHLIFEDSLNQDIEEFVARIWAEIERQHLPRMLEDLESLQYVPVWVRRKAAEEPLLLARCE